MSHYRLHHPGKPKESMFAIHRATSSLCLMTDGRGRGVIVVGRGREECHDGLLIAGEPDDFEPLPEGTVIEVLT